MVPKMDRLSASSTFTGSDSSDKTAEIGMAETPVGPRPLVPAEHEWITYTEGSMGFVADQDVSMAVGQQRGLKSRGFNDAILSRQESRVRRYHEVLNDYIEGRR